MKSLRQMLTTWRSQFLIRLLIYQWISLSILICFDPYVQSSNIFSTVAAFLQRGGGCFVFVKRCSGAAAQSSNLWVISHEEQPDGDRVSEVSLQSQCGRNRPAEQPCSLPVSSWGKWMFFPTVLKWAYVSSNHIFFKSESVISLKKAFENVLSLCFCSFSMKRANEPSVFNQNWVIPHKSSGNKQKKYFLMDHCIVIIVDWMFLFLFLKYIRTRVLRWERAVFLGCKLALLLWNSKAAELYQLSIWSIVYNTASMGTSDAPPSAVGTFSFSSTS